MAEYIKPNGSPRRGRSRREVWPYERYVYLGRPTLRNPLFVRFGPLEAKMTCCWGWNYGLSYFFAAPYGWGRPHLSSYRGGTGRQCTVFAWGWFVFHWLGRCLLRGGCHDGRG